MNPRFGLLLLAATTLIAQQEAPASGPDGRPNIVFILCDDLGYGDIGCNGPEGKIPTPHVDRLAREGMRFTDAHATSAVCTPTRYGLLTGRYNWRSRLQRGVLGGMSPPLIEADRLTVAGLLRQNGYRTACFGKWHLGMRWALKPDAKGFGDGIEKGSDGWRVDFTRPIEEGPTTFGFEHFFGIAASLDMVPYTWIHNDRVTALPAVDKAFPMKPRGKGRTRRGPAAEGFEAIDVLPILTRKTVEAIARWGSESEGRKPFFIYLPYASPHTPIAPSKPWQGRSGLNAYADFVMQNDACVGEVLEALEIHGLAESTLVIFTSDNGCSPQADFATLRKMGHDPSGGFRGHKADLWDGGHRVPFIARWPGRIAPGTRSDQVVSLIDLMATCADIIDVELPDEVGEDSVSLLPILEGEAKAPVREALVHHSISGKFSIRQGRWKLLMCSGSGGWSAPRDKKATEQGLPEVQLYDMEEDPAERRNLQAEHPEIVARLTALLERYVARGRSTPGLPQRNAVKVVVRK